MALKIPMWMLVVIVVLLACSVWRMASGCGGYDGYDGFLGALQEIPGTRLASIGWLPWSDSRYDAMDESRTAC